MCRFIVVSVKLSTEPDYRSMEWKTLPRLERKMWWAVVVHLAATTGLSDLRIILGFRIDIWLRRSQASSVSTLRRPLTEQGDSDRRSDRETQADSSSSAARSRTVLHECRTTHMAKRRSHARTCVERGVHQTGACNLTRMLNRQEHDWRGWALGAKASGAASLRLEDQSGKEPAA